MKNNHGKLIVAIMSSWLMMGVGFLSMAIFAMGLAISLAISLAMGLAMSFPSAAMAQSKIDPPIVFSGRAIVIDGDTIYVRSRGVKKIWKVRIYGVDSPEMDSKEGVMAKKQMVAILKKSNFWASCLADKRDVYDRVVAVCYGGKKLLAGVGDSINIAILRDGYGFAHRRYLTVNNFRDYVAAEQTAHDGRRGLWADDAFVRAYQRKKKF